MNHRNWTRHCFAAFLMTAAVSIFVIPALAQQPAPAAPTGPMAPEKYKNIQVLTNVPADQLDLTMRYVSAAVGLPCVSCHVQDATTGEFAFDKDDKRNKQTARTMMKMVYAINDGKFGITAACATCHGGINQPAGLTMATLLTPDQIAQMAAAAQRGAAPQGAPGGAGGGAPGGRGAQPPAPPIDDVLNKYMDAIGGKAAVEKLQSLALTGTMTTRAGQTFPFTIEEKAGKYRESVQSQPEAMTRGFDGTAGWAQNGAQSMDLKGFPLDQSLRTNDLGMALHLKDKYPTLAASGRPVPINGKDTTVVTGRADVTTEQFYFDAASGLLVRRVITTRTPLGSLREQVDYADYRAIAGVKIPFEIKRTNWNTLDTLKIADAKPNTNIADTRFAKPK